jgi:hypothetical protein
MIPDTFVVGMTTLPVVPEVLDAAVPLEALNTPKLTEVEFVAVVPLPLWVMDEATDPEEAVTLCIDEVGWVPPELDTPEVVAPAVRAVELEAVAAVSDGDDEAAAAAAADVVLVVPAVAAPVTGSLEVSMKSVM